ncbi:MAG: dephospho-CoA kinase [Chitinophagales bacterium]|nr:dephospho-CoA kinase [Chitinophagales bacterium]
MLQVGITGGIGTGKTYVCRFFEKLGIPVYYADDRAKAIMNEDPELKEGIMQAFGKDTYKNGLLDRPFLASKVFNDKVALEKLNALVHPAVFRDTANWTAQHAHVPYTIKEAALLYESGSWQILDKIIVVSAPLETRLERVMARDGFTEEDVKARMANQWSQEEKEKRADYVILNDGKHDVAAQVADIHRQLLSLAVNP